MLQTVLAAVRKLDAMPRAQAADAMSVLLDFAAQRHDRATFMNVLGKDRAMQSWLYQLGADEGGAKGEVRGQIKNARQTCADLVKELHPVLADALIPAIEACDQAETLRSWTLQCAKLSDEASTRLRRRSSRTWTCEDAGESRKLPVDDACKAIAAGTIDRRPPGVRDGWAGPRSRGAGIGVRPGPQAPPSSARYSRAARVWSS